MTWTGLLLVLGATACFTTVDLLRKIAAETLELVPVMVWIGLGAVPLFATW